MVVYRCDNCGAEVALSYEATGSVYLRKDKIIVWAQAYILMEHPAKPGIEWIDPREEDRVHICKGCTEAAAREGEIVTEWLK